MKPAAEPSTVVTAFDCYEQALKWTGRGNAVRQTDTVVKESCYTFFAALSEGRNPAYGDRQWPSAQFGVPLAPIRPIRWGAHISVNEEFVNVGAPNATGLGRGLCTNATAVCAQRRRSEVKLGEVLPRIELPIGFARDILKTASIRD